MRCSVVHRSGIPRKSFAHLQSLLHHKEKGKGTGLGLSIVHGVVSKAGGFIDGRKRRRVGTTFQFTLPIDNRTTDQDGHRGAAKTENGHRPVAGVDDLDLVLEFAANFLKQAGYQVFTANSAEPH